MRFHRFILRAAVCCALAVSSRSAADEVTRIVLVGDSTVASGSGWGDGLIKLMAPCVVGINLAVRGRSSKSYRAEGYWQKVLEKKPNWVMIQFGHNDQPGKGPKLEPDAKTTFRENLVRYIDEAKAIGAKPVLVTSLVRRNFDPQGKILPDLLVPYVEAARIVAAEKGVPLIDLYARSVEEMNRIGPVAAVPYDAKSKDPATPDKTHLSNFGETETAKLVAGEIRKVSPELAKNLNP